MDKLQPILKHHFWILLVPILSMNLWGYFSANGAIKAATQTRQDQLENAKKGIPSGTNDPNQKYIDELKKRNDVLEKYVDEELLDLWNRQKVRMVWPAGVAADIPKVYKSSIKDNKVRFTYQKEYPDIIRQLHESVEPFVADKRGITWTPKVDFPIQLIPQVKIGDMAIESKVMWDAQEDIWVTQLILDAIRLMNKDADSETSAVIRRVISYRLLGGNGETAGEGDAAAGDSGGGEGEMGGMSAYMSSKGGAGGGGMGQGQANGSRVTSSVKFDPAEEFGTGGEAETNANGGAMGSGGGGSESMLAAMSSRMANDEGGGAEESAAEEDTGPLRYVAEKEEAKFVERGFYLSVVINQNKIVDFLVTLANSEWPVRIVRFQMGKNPYAPDPFGSRSSGGFSGAGGAMSSMSRMGRGGYGGSAPPAGNAFSSGGFSSGGFSPGGDEGIGLGKGGAMSSMGMGMGGNMAANTGYPADALQHPDLVQLDLAGLVTIYRQPKSEIPAEGEAAEGEDKTEETPADGATADAAPAADGEAGAPDAAATQPEGSGDEKSAEIPVKPEGETTAETPATGEQSATEGVPEGTAPSEGTPGEAPAAESAPSVDPSAATPSEDAESAPAADPAVPEGAVPENPTKPE